MAYAIEEGELLTDAIRRIAREQIDRAVAESGGRPLHRAVHQVRKRCKKVRSLLRLFRGSVGDVFARENRRFRDLAGQLADLRDAWVVIDKTVELQRSHALQLSDPAERVVRDLRCRNLEDDPGTALARAREQLLVAADDVAGWRVEGNGWDALAPGITRTYKRARNRCRDADGGFDSETLHEWRKRAKYHRHGLRLLRRAWPRLLNARRSELARLTGDLGNHHDLQVHADLLRLEAPGAPGDAAVIRGVTSKRQHRLAERALDLGRRLFAESPGDFERRIGIYWRVHRGARAA